MKEPTHTPAAEHLVRAIDFPHLRDGGRWQQERSPDQTTPFCRACLYATELRALGMADADIACLLADLYWDAATELRLQAEARAAAELPLPPIEDLADILAEEDEPSKVVIDTDRQTATLHYTYPYEIDLERIHNERHLLRWALHLCEKNWMDTAQLHEVVTAIAEHKGFNLHGL